MLDDGKADFGRSDDGEGELVGSADLPLGLELRKELADVRHSGQTLNLCLLGVDWSGREATCGVPLEDLHMAWSRTAGQTQRREGQRPEEWIKENRVRRTLLPNLEGSLLAPTTAKRDESKKRFIALETDIFAFCLLPCWLVGKERRAISH